MTVRRGFTLVEMLIVVVIIGILASIVVPEFATAHNDAKEAALIQNLSAVRNTLETFHFLQGGRYPQTVEELEATIGLMPMNPFVIGRGVKLIHDPNTHVVPNEDELDAKGQKIGWLYCPSTGKLWANSQTLVSTQGKAANEL